MSHSIQTFGLIETQNRLLYFKLFYLVSNNFISPKIYARNLYINDAFKKFIM